MSPLARYELEILHIVEWAVYQSQGIQEYRRNQTSREAR